jgi:hypothetical protein
MHPDQGESMTAPTAMEKSVTNLWRSLPYQAFGICANPACGERGVQFLCGKNPHSRVCLVCFEFEFNCTAPNMRRRSA